MIELDGSFGEGGGSVVRTALGMSALTGMPFRIRDIRKGRPNPGLQAQHLAAVLAVKELCNGEVEGAVLGSSEIAFVPGEVKPRTLSVDIGTAGSITLLLQAIILPCIFSKGKFRLRITGGTDTNWSPQIDYFRYIFLDAIKDFSHIETKLEQRGYYPKGGGRIDLTVESRLSFRDYSSLEEFRRALGHRIDYSTSGKLAWIDGISHASSDLSGNKVAERQAEAARKELSRLSCRTKIRIEYSNSLGTGSGITLMANLEPGLVIGSDSLGEKGKRAEEVGAEAAMNLLKELASGAPVDRYLADQLIPYLALAGGALRTSEFTRHTATNIYVVEKFLGNIFSRDNLLIRTI